MRAYGSFGQRVAVTGQCLHEGGSIVGAEVYDAVDEQGRRAPHLARTDSAGDVSPDTPRDGGAVSIAIEACDVEFELGGVPPKIVVPAQQGSPRAPRRYQTCGSTRAVDWA